MQPILHTETTKLNIIWDESCGIFNHIKNAKTLEGVATHIQGEVFFYQYELDIPFNGEEREVFDVGDVVYWRSQTDATKFGILFMYGNTTYGDGTKPRTSSPGIKIGKVVNHEAIQQIQTDEKVILGSIMKNFTIKSIRTFIGAKDYELSRNFYRDFGFEEIIIFPKMSYFCLGDFGFYLQDADVKDWINNSMVFMEVTDLQQHFEHVKSLKLHQKYENVRLKEIVYNDWGNEFFIYDPSGILWHIGEFIN